ncbi:transcriptional regulator [Tahibacter aquaticus]|uniref:Transcriptional regulator n=1 Tax=Tahibacter aquaticus TaxID=520092 RepID=A0A4R6Z4W1_9GAMM|nr:winged helix-turn-helix domain-containing protein [Tahibacter aquaticus]TDR46589.1 transcriptional regulator [Tahibacter aquaticus]
MSRPVYRFASFRLDVAARELRGDGVLLNVSPKVFDGLVWLIEHRDRAIGRDELIAAIWGRADVTDAQLGQLMRKLRRAVGDEGEGQSLVRTVPRFGYRWVAETRLEPAAATPVAADTPPAAPAVPAKPRRRWAMAGIAAVLLAAIGLAWWQTRRDAHENDVIAVLPVAIEPAGERESAWLRLGLMDQLAEELRRAGLRVVPSDNIATAARNDGTALLGEERVTAATGARRFVAATTRRMASGWVSRIEWREEGRVRREVEASADSAVGATRKASRQLLLALGRPPAALGAEQGDAAAAQWLERIDALLLDTDFPAARAALASAPEALRRSVAGQLRQADLELATQRMAEARQGYVAVLAHEPATEIDALTRARALIGVAGPVAQEGDLAGARQHLSSAIGILDALNAPQLLGEALYGRGMFALVQGDLDHAEADFSQARIALELAGASLQLARLQGQQANLLAVRHRHAEALALWSGAADRFERFGDAEAFIDALGNAATEQLSLLQPQSAQATLQRADAWLARLDHPLSDALFRFVAARVLAQNGRLQAAREQFEALLTDTATGQVSGMAATVGLELARLDLAGGNAAAAARRADAAMTRLQQPDLASPLYARIRHDGWLLLIRALRSAGDGPRAAQETQRFLAQADADEAAPVYTHLADAELQWPGNRVAAVRAYEASLAAARRSGAPGDMAEVVVSYAQALLAAGDIDAATRIAGQTSAWATQDFACAVLQARLYLALQQRDAFARAMASLRQLAGERPLPPDLAAAARTPR